ncbi:DNA replication protein DnaC, partial [Enterobacter hormaechei subsp. steigerwaltii]
MQNAGSIFDRLRRVIPAGIEPKFKSAEELMAWQREEGQKRAAEVDKLNQQARAEKIFGR